MLMNCVNCVSMNDLFFLHNMGPLALMDQF